MRQRSDGQRLDARSLEKALLVAGLLVIAACAQAATRNGVLALDLTTPMDISVGPTSNELPAPHGRLHAAIDRTLALEEARCYQQFSVNSCLSEARARARADQGVLDERERLEKAARRQAGSDEHRRERLLRETDSENLRQSTTSASHSGVQAQQAVPVSDSTRSGSPVLDARSVGVTSPRGQSQREARTEAKIQRDERAVAQAKRDEGAADARARLSERRAAAERHQASIQQRKQARDARGGTPPAPLPAAAGDSGL